jgi:hypothetical protein
MVIVNGEHVFAKACIEKKRLDREIAAGREQRSQVQAQIASARHDLSRVDTRLEMSTVAERGSDHDFECRSRFTLRNQRPALARPEHEAVELGRAICRRCLGEGSSAGCELEAKAELGVEPNASLDRFSEGFVSDLGVALFKGLGRDAFERGEGGPGAIAYLMAAWFQYENHEACITSVAEASFNLYEVWSFERQYRGREADLVPVCESWLQERAEQLDVLGDLHLADGQVATHIQDLGRERNPHLSEIRRAGLSCR